MTENQQCFIQKLHQYAKAKNIKYTPVDIAKSAILAAVEDYDLFGIFFFIVITLI